MKFLVANFCFLAVLVLTTATPNLDDIENECKKESSDNSEYCLFKCILLKAEVIREDGSLLEDKFSGLTGVFAEDGQTFKACHAKFNDDDLCARINNVMKCVNDAGVLGRY